MSYPRILILFLFSIPAVAADNLAFDNAYVAAAPPGAEAMAAYMTIKNPGTRLHRITSIRSGDFSEVQIHRSSIENGIARMQQLEYLSIEAESSVELSPGGLHLMLIGPVEDFDEGETILLEFTEADGTTHALALKVQRNDAADHHQHHHH